MSDPRLEGTWYNSNSGGEYYLPGDDPYPLGSPLEIDAVTWRMENDEGAWQGSFLETTFPDDESSVGPLVMIGEGAYEGLTAVMITDGEDCPNTQGYIIEDSIPEPPVPQTGQ